MMGIVGSCLPAWYSHDIPNSSGFDFLVSFFSATTIDADYHLSYVGPTVWIVSEKVTS